MVEEFRLTPVLNYFAFDCVVGHVTLIDVTGGSSEDSSDHYVSSGVSESMFSDSLK